MISDDDMRLIDDVRMLGWGYGWQKYADSVKKGGQVSDAQRATLIRMLNLLNSHRTCSAINRRRSGRRHSSWQPDISDCEAMRFGEYF